MRYGVPYTFAVFALLLMIIGPLSILNTPVDIFPNIDIPVVSIVWQYQGLSAVDMANRIITLTERSLTTTVDNIDHIESQSTYRHCRRQGLLPAARSILPPPSRRSPQYRKPNLRQLPAGHNPSPDHYLYRVERTDSAVGALRRGTVRTAIQRLSG